LNTDLCELYLTDCTAVASDVCNEWSHSVYCRFSDNKTNRSSLIMTSVMSKHLTLVQKNEVKHYSFGATFPFVGVHNLNTEVSTVK
jgi:hypothetical protein